MNKSILDARNTKRAEKGKDPIKRKFANQTLQLGLNFRMQTGLPYTPFDTVASALTVNWDRFGQALRDYSLLNTERTNLFYGVDFRIDYKWFYQKWSLNLYFDLQNFPSQAAQVPQYTLDEDENNNNQPQIVNQGQPNQSYLLQRVNNTLSVSVPSIGIIVQF
jgi:hypothetical protein